MDSVPGSQLPKTARESELERLSRNLFEYQVGIGEFLWRHESEDKGVDGSIEVLDSNQATNLRAQVQLKGTDKESLKRDGSITYAVTVRNLCYLQNGGDGLYVLYVDPRRELRYVWAIDEIDRLERENPGWRHQETVRLNFKKVLTPARRDEIRERILAYHSQNRVATPPGQPLADVSGLPAEPAHGFVGRFDVVTALIQRLISGAGQQTHTLQGVGGIGKTTVAAMVGHHAVVRKYFSRILWVSLGPKPNVRERLHLLGDMVGVELRGKREPEACSLALSQRLANERTLLILDDLWDYSAFEYFRAIAERSTTLVTTRELPVAYWLSTPDRTCPLEALTLPEALRLFGSVSGGIDRLHPDPSTELVRVLGCHPLGIVLAGRMLATEGLSMLERLPSLLDALIRTPDERMRLFVAESRAGSLHDQPRSLYGVLALSLERLSKDHCARFAELSIMGAEPLTWDSDEASAVWDCSKAEAEHTISALIQRALVSRKADRYTVHPVVWDCADVLRRQINHERR